jgi:hypothetical protein
MKKIIKNKKSYTYLYLYKKKQLRIKNLFKFKKKKWNINKSPSQLLENSMTGISDTCREFLRHISECMAQRLRSENHWMEF